MKPGHTRLLTIVVLGAAVVLTLSIWRNMEELAGAMGCEDKIVSETNSPDATNRLIQYQRFCGATAPDTLQASIYPANVKFDSKKFPPFLVVEIPARTETEWKTSSEVSVKLSPGARVYRNDSNSRNVHIVYGL